MMECKFKDLIELHRHKFSAVVDAERLLPILENVETLTNAEVSEINKLTTNKEKVEKVLDILLHKDNLAFKSLCHALESTYPHLLTVMFLGNSPAIRSTSASGSDVRTSDSEDDVLRRSHSSDYISSRLQWRGYTSCDARSQDLKTYTRKIPSYEYDDFQDLGSSLEGSLGDAQISGAKHKHRSGRYKHSLNGEHRHSSHSRDYDWLKSQCERAMTELQALKMQQSDNTKRYDAVIKESDSYRQSYMSTLSQLQQAREDAEAIRGQNHDLRVENKRIEQEVKNVLKLREEDLREMDELRKHQREIVSKSGSTEVLNALDMYDRIKQDYDTLRVRYSDLVTTHSSLQTKFESAQEENTQLKKQNQALCTERDAAILERNGLKQQCTAAIRNWDQVLHERNDMNEKITKITQQRDDIMKDMNQALAAQLRAKKELEVVSKDKEAVYKEYNLIMSERDQVHKEIEQLNEKLAQGANKIETLMKEKKASQDEAETLKREITAALQDRDKSVKERNEFNDKCNELLSKHSAIEKQKEDFKKEVEMSIQQRDIARKERQEAMQDRDRILREKYEREQFQKENADKMDQFNRETEQLKKQIELLQQKLYDGMHEAEIYKNRRDWAMSERDKIVQERDSMRTLCDSLRRDRDRAVSDLAQALRDYDDMKKQKSDAVRELKDYKDKFDMVSEKECRKSQLNSVGHNNSRDSAIDADLQEFETETLDIELTGLNKDDLGFELVGGKDDPQYPNDTSIFVSHVTKGSPADGKLRVNDQIMRISNKEVSNVEKRFAYSLLRNRSGIVNMQVMRRRKISPSRSWQAIQLTIPAGKDIGIQLENGLYVTRVNPGSYSAKEGLITIGDRIISVNGRSVENMSPDDLQKILYQYGGDTIVLDIARQTTPLSSAGSSPLPLTANMQDPLLVSPLKNEGLKPWESASESSKGSMKNIKSSGSQTDSLDSPVVPRRKKDKKGSDKDIDHKTRHSVHIFDRAIEAVDKFFGPRNKSTERMDSEKGMLSLPVGRPRTMIEDRDTEDIAQFAFPTHHRENSNSSNTNRSSGRQKQERPENLDPEMSGTGTWPKMRNINTVNTVNGTVIQTQKNHHKRPTIDAVISHSEDQGVGIPTARVPPLPPQRSNSSFSAVRHTPQNSDSTITFSSPPSPSLSPQPSNASSSSYFNKSPALTPRHSYSQESQDATSLTSHSGYQMGTGSQPSYLVQRGKINPKSPPRMPPIHSQVATNQYNLKPSNGQPLARRRPTSGPSHDQRNSSSNVQLLYPSSQGQAPPNYFVGSRNTTPEPLSRPIEFIDRPPGGRHYPIPSPGSHSSSLPTASQPVLSRQHDVHQATKTVLPYPAHATPTPRNAFLPENLTELDDLPAYPCGMSDVSSPSPSIVSESRFTPTHVDGHYIYSYHNRMHIPSIQSATATDTSGSVEIVSDIDSPISPFPEISISKMLPSYSPHAELGHGRKQPKPGETRKISIEKTSKPVGFQIEMGPVSGGIFVSSVNENSLAAQAGLVIGDQLLEICAINMRNATYDLAARVLQQCGNNLTMLVQYNPEKYNDNNSSSGHSTPDQSPQTSPKIKQTGSQRVPSFNHTRPPARVASHNSGGKYDNPRKISFKKPNPSASLGISLTGGNATGIFIQNVEENSPAHIQNIHTGDQILEYNGIDFTRATAEQAFRHLNEPCSSVRFKLRYHPSLYNKVRSKKSCDSVYVRAMMEHTAEREGELSFRRDDLLYIEDTMYNGEQGVWYAWLINDEGQKIKGGTIPSKDRMEDDLSLHRSLSDSTSLHGSEEFKVPARRGSGSARRSFWRRSKKHQRNNSKDSRDFNSFSDVSLNSDSLPVLDDSMSTYLSVERLEYKKTRPVVLIAPLADALIQKLSAESPDKYFYCQPTVMQTSMSAMHEGQKDGHYIDFWQVEDRFHCIRTKSVTEMCNKNIHCLLNVNPASIERLQRQQIYPIVIYARHKSYKSLREVKDVQFLPEKLSIKSSKELYEYCLKAEQDYRPLITATIQGGNLAEMSQQIKNVITAEQEKPIWVPSSMLR
ncbi:disks large homolog 5-like isoform X2 [Mya arenaria]|uniref:disks large homolog 5-like isoform X2 n=1 Tax=Mya arenaria TaxID=6604 RepID=UPI0022E1AE37|nr:disks large homolog 5-like isoform X2 [Mya arenaria]